MQKLRRDGGPEFTYNARPGIGSVSPAAYAVRVAPGDAEAAFEIPERIEAAEVAPGALLQYDWFPVAGPGLESRWDATAFALDVEFGDGSLLSETAPRDQHGNGVTPEAQAAAKTLYVDQWNRRAVVLPDAAAHGIRTLIARVRGAADHDVAGWLDGVRVMAAPVTPAEPLDRVDTTRGTQSSDTFSRGNTAPLVAVPHGGVFGLPMTDASAGNWPYAYHRHDRDDARPAIQAFATSHIPSPWIGDRGVFQLMPSPLAAPPAGRAERALGFDHEHESARPHRYDVELDGGIRAQLTAGDFALGLRFTRNIAGPLAVVVDHLGAVAAASWGRTADGFELDAELDDGPGKPRHFVHLRLPAGGRDELDLAERRLSGHIAYSVGGMGSVDALIGISTIGAAQARANLDVAGGFDAMAAEAGRRWRGKLGVLELDGASADQARSLFDVLAANELAVALNPRLRPGENRLRSLMLDPEEQAFQRDWERNAAGFVASFRQQVGEGVGDARVLELIGELTVASGRFNELWARHDVKALGGGSLDVEHPVVGAMRLHRDKLPVEDVLLVVYYADEGSESAERLRLLGSLAVS